jgi:hypothetical protein
VKTSAGWLSSPAPPQLQQRSPRFCGGLPHRTHGPAPEAARRVAALPAIYDHRRHVAAPLRRHWRHRHSSVPPPACDYLCSTLWLAGAGGEALAGAVGATVRLEAHAVPTLGSHRSEASRWKSACSSPSVSRARNLGSGCVWFRNVDDGQGAGVSSPNSPKSSSNDSPFVLRR